MEQILNMLLPYVITAIGGYVGAKLTKVIPVAIDYIIAKIGLVRYQKMKNISLDIWSAIDEDNRLGELATSKITAFETMIKNHFPNITDDEIRLLNKSIAGVVNADKEKVVQAVAETEQAIVTVQPTVTVKYITPEGTELTPLIPVNINNTTLDLSVQNTTAQAEVTTTATDRTIISGPNVNPAIQNTTA